eukprot:2178281-Pleurochrysis_carterae.AAC.1
MGAARTFETSSTTLDFDSTSAATRSDTDSFDKSLKNSAKSTVMISSETASGSSKTASAANPVVLPANCSDSGTIIIPTQLRSCELVHLSSKSSDAASDARVTFEPAAPTIGVVDDSIRQVSKGILTTTSLSDDKWQATRQVRRAKSFAGAKSFAASVETALHSSVPSHSGLDAMVAAIPRSGVSIHSHDSSRLFSSARSRRGSALPAQCGVASKMSSRRAVASEVAISSELNDLDATR